MNIRTLQRLSAAVAPLVLLAACGGAPRPSAPAAAAVPHAAAVVPAPSAPAAVPAAPMGPAKLKGMAAAEVKVLLGTPSFRRRDVPAEIWQYRGRACTLDVFLYDRTDGQTVTHFAVRSPGGQGDQECFDDVKAAAAGS
ncbi:MAG: hypothetical protein HY985_13030 [Magnetospirillum sp.]|nr:hypothetical protein [Magnetospirillum sp.]